MDEEPQLAPKRGKNMTAAEISGSTRVLLLKHAGPNNGVHKNEECQVRE
jgi:hypothetical protein